MGWVRIMNGIPVAVGGKLAFEVNEPRGAVGTSEFAFFPATSLEQAMLLRLQMHLAIRCLANIPDPKIVACTRHAAPDIARMSPLSLRLLLHLQLVEDQRIALQQVGQERVRRAICP